MKNVSLIIDFLTGKFPRFFIFELTCGEFLFCNWLRGVECGEREGGNERRGFGGQK